MNLGLDRIPLEFDQLVATGTLPGHEASDLPENIPTSLLRMVQAWNALNPGTVDEVTALKWVVVAMAKQRRRDVRELVRLNSTNPEPIRL